LSLGSGLGFEFTFRTIPNGKITTAVPLPLIHCLLSFGNAKGCVYFVSWCRSTAGTILPSTNHVEGKIAPVVVLPYEAK